MDAAKNRFTVTIEGVPSPVLVTRKNVRNLNLRIRPDGSVALSIPKRADEAAAREFLARKADWIAKHLERIRQKDESERLEDTCGDGRSPSLPLWGRLVDAAEILGGCDPGSLAPEELDRRIDELYRAETTAALPAAADAMQRAMGVRASRWTVRTMSSRWGSCTPGTGAIRINAKLAAYPPECLKFVVAHELVHLTEPSHNARFHALLDRYCPKNREIAKILRKPAREAASRPSP